MIANLSKTLTELSVTREQISSLDDTTRNSLKKDLLSIISSIVQELREMVSKKKKSLDAIMQKVDEDWKSSCLAGSISYLHTKIHLRVYVQFWNALMSLDSFCHV